MKAAERRDAIIKKLKNSAEPLSGAALAQELGVSRQVIVQDISILRAQGNEVLSTNRGYVLQHSEEASRVFKVIHTEEEIQKEFWGHAVFGHQQPVCLSPDLLQQRQGQDRAH